MLRHRKSFYSVERVPHVYCQNCAEHVPNTEVDHFDNIEEGPSGEDIVSGVHKICGQRFTSTVIMREC